eukprot:CAMPEP_0117608652 /NCGR_PEP_ID=MMETSP0784-20121206/80917_1 /TAXON_ID=39447 /ORGANISM="" /LENGTH=330 /DNA_ID=CAMNT_0005411929 /DNA_START=1 /DNA_END=993 /DNA_ORIENTATION=-
MPPTTDASIVSKEFNLKHAVEETKERGRKHRAAIAATDDDASSGGVDGQVTGKKRPRVANNVENILNVEGKVGGKENGITGESPGRLKRRRAPPTVAEKDDEEDDAAMCQSRGPDAHNNEGRRGTDKGGNSTAELSDLEEEAAPARNSPFFFGAGDDDVDDDAWRRDLEELRRRRKAQKEQDVMAAPKSRLTAKPDTEQLVQSVRDAIESGDWAEITAPLTLPRLPTVIATVQDVGKRELRESFRPLLKTLTQRFGGMRRNGQVWACLGKWRLVRSLAAARHMQQGGVVDIERADAAKSDEEASAEEGEAECDEEVASDAGGDESGDDDA